MSSFRKALGLTYTLLRDIQLLEEADREAGEKGAVDVELEPLPSPIGVSCMQYNLRRLYTEIRYMLLCHAHLRTERLANRFGGLRPDEGNRWNPTARQICPVCGNKLTKES